MKTHFIAFCIAVASVAAFAEPVAPENSCPPVPTGRKSPQPLSPTKIHSPTPPITVNCGSVSVSQPVVEPQKSNSDSPCTGASSQWEKIIDALSKLLSSIAWPLAGTYIAIVFRKELAALLARLKRGKVGSAEFEFGESVRKVETQAEAANLPRLENSVGHEQLRKDKDDLFVLARTYARAAVFEAWVRLEVAIGQGLRNTQVITDGEKRSADYAAVKGAQVLFKDYPKQLNYFNTLRNLRNKVAHGELNAITHEPACAFIELAFRLILFIENTWPRVC